MSTLRAGCVVPKVAPTVTRRRAAGKGLRLGRRTRRHLASVDAIDATDPPMFSYLQSRIRGTATTGPGAPPPGLLAFYWHFVRQTKGWSALMSVTSLAVPLTDTVIPVFIGKLVSLMEAVDRKAALNDQWPLLVGMVALVLVVRPLVMLVDVAIRHNAIIPGATSLIRWQSHWHVVRQSWPFFQNDFAGRIANRVMQTANALRESTMASIRAVWYILAYGLSALV